MRVVDTMVKSVKRSVIDHIKELCDFPAESIMVKLIDQQGWTNLGHVTTIAIDEAMDFAMTKSDGTVRAKPRAHHHRMLACFLTYYISKCMELSTSLSEEDVLEFNKEDFMMYRVSSSYHDDIVAYLAMMSKINPSLGSMKYAVLKNMTE